MCEKIVETILGEVENWDMEANLNDTGWWISRGGRVLKSLEGADKKLQLDIVEMEEPKDRIRTVAKEDASKWNPCELGDVVVVKMTDDGNKISVIKTKK